MMKDTAQLTVARRVTAVPLEELAALAGAVREGDLSAVQAERLAGLVERIGDCVRIAAEYPQCTISLARLWIPLAERFGELLECSR